MVFSLHQNLEEQTSHCVKHKKLLPEENNVLQTWF